MLEHSSMDKQSGNNKDAEVGAGLYGKGLSNHAGSAGEHSLARQWWD